MVSIILEVVKIAWVIHALQNFPAISNVGFGIFDARTENVFQTVFIDKLIGNYSVAVSYRVVKTLITWTP